MSPLPLNHLEEMDKFSLAKQCKGSWNWSAAKGWWSWGGRRIHPVRKTPLNSPFPVALNGTWKMGRTLPAQEQ